MLVTLVVGCCWSTTVSAQSITVQQPVVQTFSVDTVVTVPDRGSALLGSMSGAGDFRSRSGFSPFGSSVGGYRNHSSANATVYIHDFAAMDEALLAQPVATRLTERPQQRPVVVDPLVARARASLLADHARRHRP
jgi:hypothetical protein